MVPCGEEGAALSLSLLLHIRKKVFQYLCEERKTRRRRRHEYEGREGRGAAPLSDGVDGAAEAEAAEAAADRVSNPREGKAARRPPGRGKEGRKPDADERTSEGEREMEREMEDR